LQRHTEKQQVRSFVQVPYNQLLINCEIAH
jgi:hypothetical protein